jgi:hypothetical protein
VQLLTITNKVVSSNHAHGEVNSIQLYVRVCLKVTCRRSVSFPDSSTNKPDHHDIAKILLKVALNTITLFYLWEVNKSHDKRPLPLDFKFHFIFFYVNEKNSNNY